ncbi:hypothetical protein HYV88_05345 [Candidatus Woesearchaeota archaeon]|nr:hypothetical protein [Candidatus Woesearchaeota archaeon]
MTNKRYFEYLYTHPNNPLSRLLMEFGDFIYRNFTSVIDEKNQRIVDLTAQTLRTAISLNQYRARLEVGNQLLKEQAERERLKKENALKAWSQQYDLAQRLPRELPARVLEIQRRVQKSRTPRIWADLEGKIQITNLPNGNLLVGRSLKDYLVEAQYPNTARSYEEVTGIQHNKRIYEIKDMVRSVEGDISIGTMVKLKKTRARKIKNAEEGLLRSKEGFLRRTIMGLHHRRQQAKPRET